MVLMLMLIKMVLDDHADVGVSGNSHCNNGVRTVTVISQ